MLKYASKYPCLNDATHVGCRYTYASAISEGIATVNSSANYQTNASYLFGHNAVGEYTITIGSYSDGSGLVNNYDISSDEVTFTIERKNVDQYVWTMSDGVTSSTSVFTQTYSGNTWTLTAVVNGRAYGTVTATDGNTVGSETVSVNGSNNSTLLSGSSQRNVGSYTASIIAGNAADGKYSTVAATRSYQIDQLALTLGTSGANSDGWSILSNIIYSGSAWAPATYTFGNVVSGDTVTATYTYYTEYTDATTNIQTSNANSGASASGAAPIWAGTYYVKVVALIVI